jgi:hypothetical protein
MRRIWLTLLVLLTASLEHSLLEMIKIRASQINSL